MEHFVNLQPKLARTTTVGTQYVQYRDLAGIVHSPIINNGVPIGIMPILVENQYSNTRPGSRHRQ